MPSEMKVARHSRTRPDGFGEVWPEIGDLLRNNPALEAKTILAALQRQYPDRFADGQLRTLQHRMKTWRATGGPAQEVYFMQEHRAGELCKSDFTHLSDLGVTIAGELFAHMLYYFVLTYSNWETATICQSESFASLSEGLQNALWELGGVPRLHRTDRMTSAVNNLTEQAEFQKNYQALLRHYGLDGRKIQTGQPNENGDIEQRNYRLQRALEQALLLRDSRDFATVEECRCCPSGRRNGAVAATAGAMPGEREACACTGELRQPDRGGAERLFGEQPSIGEIVEARVYSSQLRSGMAAQKVDQFARSVAAPTTASITATSSTNASFQIGIRHRSSSTSIHIDRRNSRSVSGGTWNSRTIMTLPYVSVDDIPVRLSEFTRRLVRG